MNDVNAQAATITRIQLRFERDFTQLPNAWLRDKRLSRGARGLLCEIMTHDTQTFKLTIEGLVATGLEGRDALRKMVSELERYGYLHRIQKRRQGGRLAGHDWVIQDPFEGVDGSGAAPLWPVDNSASADAPTVSDSPAPVKPTSVPPSTVKPTPIEDQSKNKRTTDPAQPQSAPAAPVENFGVVRFADDRCPGNYRDGRHELGKHGMCTWCHERPVVRSVR